MVLLTIQPTAVDQAIARAMARKAHPPLERSAEVLTLAADERVLLAVVGGLFIVSLFGSARQGRAGAYLAANAACRCATSSQAPRRPATARPQCSAGRPGDSAFRQTL